MKKLLFISFLAFLLGAFFSCSSNDELAAKDDEEQMIEDTVYRERTIYLKDNSVDTFYFSERKYYENRIFWILIYKERDSIKDEYLAHACFFSDGFTPPEQIKRPENVESSENGDIYGDIQYGDDNRVKRIELFNWFVISRIYIKDKPAYELRAIGPTPDRVYAKLEFIEGRGSTFYIK